MRERGRVRRRAPGDSQARPARDGLEPQPGPLRRAQDQCLRLALVEPDLGPHAVQRVRERRGRGRRARERAAGCRHELEREGGLVGRLGADVVHHRWRERVAHPRREDREECRRLDGRVRGAGLQPDPRAQLLAVARDQVALDRGRGRVVSRRRVAEAEVQLLGDGEVVEGTGRVELVGHRLAERGQAGEGGDPQVTPGRRVVAHRLQRLAQAVHLESIRRQDRDAGRQPRVEAAVRQQARPDGPRAGLVLGRPDRVPRRIERVGRQRAGIPVEGPDEQAAGRRGGDRPVEAQAGRLDERVEVGHVAGTAGVGEACTSPPRPPR